jgi:hypothetical protein
LIGWDQLTGGDLKQDRFTRDGITWFSWDSHVAKEPFAKIRQALYISSKQSLAMLR